MKKLLTIFFLLFTTQAFAILPQFYLGGGIGSGKLQQKTTSGDTTLQSSNAYKLAFNARIGVMFTDNIGAELGQSYVLNDKFNYNTISVTSKNNKLTYLALKGAIDATPILTFYGKIGAAYVQSEVETVNAILIGSTVTKHTGFRPYGALGVNIHVNPILALYGEFSAIPSTGKVPGNTMGVIGIDFFFPTA